MSDAAPSVVRVTRVYTAAADDVFGAWIDPEIAGRWLFATPGGQMVEVRIDARVGGSFTITERRGQEDVAHVGEYQEVDRPRRLEFTFGVSKFSDVRTAVAIDVRALRTGCELTLTHEGVLPEMRERVQEGWGKLLGNLATSIGAT